MNSAGIEATNAQAQGARPEWTTVAALVIILTVALLLRVYQIGEQELWFDEAFSFHVATLSSGFGQALRLENTPPLYYLLLRAWIPIAGTGEAAVRLLSAIFSTLFVLAVFWAGMEFFNRRVALWSSCFAAVAPVQIYYAQEARAYALAAAAVLAAYVLLWRALKRQTFAAWLSFCVLALAALYTHYFTLIALLPTVILHRRGYRWEAGQCSDAARSRQFGCRLLPLTYERSLGYDPRVNQRASDSAAEISQGLLGTVSGENGSLWVVLDSGAFAHSRTQEPEFLSALAGELGQRGFTLVETSVEGVPGILQFRRPSNQGQS